MLCIKDCLLVSKNVFELLCFVIVALVKKNSSVMPLEYVSFVFQPLILSLKICQDTVVTKSCYKGSRAPQFG